jgi:hypothetical protein
MVDMLPGVEPSALRHDKEDESMNFIMLHRWGKSERSGDEDALGALLAELDVPEKDDEHVSVAVRLPSGWCVGVYLSGLVVYENVEDLAVEPRHLRVEMRGAARRLMDLLVRGDLVELERQAWRPGNGV